MLSNDGYNITEHAYMRFKQRCSSVGTKSVASLVSLLDEASSQNAKKIPSVKKRCKSARAQGLRFKATKGRFVFLLSNENTLITCYQA